MSVESGARVEGEPIVKAKKAKPAVVEVVEPVTVAQSDHFVAFLDVDRNVWSVQPVGWVGEAPLLVHASKIASLKDLLAVIV